MKTRRTIVLTALMALVVGACGTAAVAVADRAGVRGPDRDRRGIGIRIRVGGGVGLGRARAARPRCRSTRPRRSSRASSRAPTIEFWTFYLSPTFDNYIKDTIARFQATYPGVDRHVARPPGHVQGRPEQLVRRGQRAGRHQPLGQRGLGQRVRGQGPAARPRHAGPAGRQGHLLPEPLEAAAHRRRELPVPVVPGPQRRAAQQGASSTRPASIRPRSRRRSTGSRPCARRSSTRRGTAVRHPPDRQRPARRRWSTRATSRSSAPTARPSPSTRPRAWRGCRCTST